MRTSLLLLLIPFVANAAVGVDVEIDGGEPDYYDGGYYYEDTPWIGPGMYWGIYIGSENDYWYYHNHYHGHHDHDGHHHGDGHHGGGGGHHGGGGHGGHH